PSEPEAKTTKQESTDSGQRPVYAHRRVQRHSRTQPLPNTAVGPTIAARTGSARSQNATTLGHSRLSPRETPGPEERSLAPQARGEDRRSPGSTQRMPAAAARRPVRRSLEQQRRTATCSASPTGFEPVLQP